MALRLEIIAVAGGAAVVDEVDWALNELAFEGAVAAVGEIWGRAGFESREAGAGGIGDPEKEMDLLRAETAAVEEQLRRG